MEDKGLKISSKKTEYLSFNEDQVPNVVTDGERLNAVGKFKSPGSTVANDGNVSGCRDNTQNGNWVEKLKVGDCMINVKVTGRVQKTS